MLEHRESGTEGGVGNSADHHGINHQGCIHEAIGAPGSGERLMEIIKGVDLSGKHQHVFGKKLRDFHAR